jgi:hypothetical protein
VGEGAWRRQSTTEDGAWRRGGARARRGRGISIRRGIREPCDRDETPYADMGRGRDGMRAQDGARAQVLRLDAGTSAGWDVGMSVG